MFPSKFNCCSVHSTAVVLCIFYCFLGVEATVTKVDVPDWIHHGDEAQIRCEFDTGVARLEWARTLLNETYESDNIVLSYSSSTSWTGPEMNRMTGVINGNTCILTIDSVDWQIDEGKYWCRVTDDDQFGSSFMDDNTTVSVSPGVLQFSDESEYYADGFSVPVIEGMDHVLTCHAEGSKPAATLTWIVDGTSTKPLQTDTRNTVPGLWDTSSSFTLTPLMVDHNKQVQCTASVPEETTVSTSFIQLYVQVAPKENDVKLFDANRQAGYSNGTLVRVDEGTMHTFTCDVRNTRPAAKIDWKVGGSTPGNDFDIIPPVTASPVTASPSDELEDATSTLSFTPEPRYHRERTECIASIDFTNAPTVIRHIVFDVYGSPTTPSISGNTKMTEGEVKPIVCSANGAYPQGDITWYIDGKNVTQSQASNVLNSNNRYDISGTLNYTPTREHNGQYLNCQATHESGNVDITSTLDIQFCAKEATLHQCPLQVMVNTATTVRCEASSSYPSSRIVWYKNLDEKESSHDHVVKDGSYGGKVTTLDYTTDALTKDDNGATLHCCARKDPISCGTETCSSMCRLNVQYPAEISSTNSDPDPPITEGNTMTLTCTASGNPQPDSFVRWEKQGSSEDLENVFSDTKSVLTISSIARHQAGYYQCVADNGIGEAARSQPITLAVHYPVNISNKLDNYRGVNEGKDAYLDCIADGLPNPVFRWYHPNGSLLTTDTPRINITQVVKEEDGVHGTVIHSQLQVTAINPDFDYGIYICQADNSIGDMDTLRVNISGTRKPFPVINLMTTLETLDTISIQWSAGYNGGGTQTFVIDYKLLPDGDYGEEQTVAETQTNFTIAGLMQGTQYLIRVRSENVNGREENGATVKGQTKRLPDSPRNVNILSQLSSTRSLTVEWVHGEAGEDKQWFFVDVRKTDGEFGENREKVSSEYTTYQVNGLAEATMYEIAVYSANVNGVNEKYSSDTDSTLSAPGTPNTQVGIVAGGVAGGTVLVVIIIILVVYLVKTSPKSNAKGDAVYALKDRSVRPVGATNTSVDIADEQAKDPKLAPVYAAVNKSQGTANSDPKSAPVYAAVNKSQGTANSAPTYAMVNKKKGVVEENTMYDDVSNIVSEESAYDDVSNLQQKSEGTENGDGRTINPDGLIYEEVSHSKSHPKGAPPIQTEPSTDYAELDFNRMKGGKN